MSASLVGSEMCIRDRPNMCSSIAATEQSLADNRSDRGDAKVRKRARFMTCLLYTSDAADDM
eukprot:10976998-Alexandrium_andersonii.AAC.1